MSIVDRISKAENSSDLSTKNHTVCDSDWLTSVGLFQSGKRLGKKSIFALVAVRISKDKKATMDCLDLFRTMSKHICKIHNVRGPGVEKVALRSMDFWIDPCCKACNGMGEVKIPGRVEWTCPRCVGSGHRFFNRETPEDLCTAWVLANAEDAFQRACKFIQKKIG